MTQPPRAWAAVGARPCVVLGRAQHGWRTDGSLPVRRRATGGGAVLCGPWLLRVAVRWPRQHPLLVDGPAAAARWLGAVHLRWLHTLGLGGAALHTGPVRDHWSCFSGRGPGEVTVGGRKIVGIAQCWQRSSVLLSAGTLLSTPPWELLCASLGRPSDEVPALRRETVALDACLATVPQPSCCARELHRALQAALEDGS